MSQKTIAITIKRYYDDGQWRYHVDRGDESIWFGEKDLSAHELCLELMLWESDLD